MAPGSGEAMAARDAWDASGRGAMALGKGEWGQAASEYGNLAAALAGAIPGIGIIARGTKRGAAWMDRNLPSGVNRLLDSAMPSDPKNTTNIFAGPTAKTADHAALGKAQEMASSGASRDDIWRDTGWFQGVDGKWRFEIDDSAMGVKIPRNADAETYSAYPKAINHPELFEAYPPMARDRIAFDHRTGDSDILLDVDQRAIGRRKNDTTIGVQGSKMMGQNELQPRKVGTVRGSTIHELQHNIQGREGFAAGTSPFGLFASGAMDSPEIATLREGLAKLKRGTPEFEALETKVMDLEFQEAVERYRRSAGEVEARNAQVRRNMNAEERRSQGPWFTQDVPDDQQIVRYR
jgi:hypothetical protein